MSAQLTAFSRHWDQEITVCQQPNHAWAEGDEGAVYCSHCTGYVCLNCNGSGRVENGLSTKRCFGCSGLGVQMWWEPEQRTINPHNWAKAAQEDPANA